MCNWSCDSMHIVEKCRDKLIGYLDGELSKPECDVDANELGKVTDMIKDLSDAEKNCFKAWYYYCEIKKDGCDDDEDDSDNSTEEMMDCRDHYHGYKNAKDDATQTMHINGFVESTTNAMREMYNHGSMDDRKKIKNDLSKLISEMAV